MSVDIRDQKDSEKNEDINIIEDINIMKRLILTFTMQSLGLNDPYVATWIYSRLSELSLVLQHAPPSFSATVILMLLDTLPDDVGIEVMKRYIDRIDMAYKTISQVFSRLTKVGGLAEQYTAQGPDEAQQQSHEPALPPLVIEKLRRIIDELNAENKKSNSSRFDGTVYA